MPWAGLWTARAQRGGRGGHWGSRKAAGVRGSERGRRRPLGNAHGVNRETPNHGWRLGEGDWTAGPAPLMCNDLTCRPHTAVGFISLSLAFQGSLKVA